MAIASNYTFRKMWLNINGADRQIIVDPAQDTLAGVLRRLGLTGTKIGCGTGVCGTCSVILNGEVVRSCNKKIRNIKDYAKVITIEGIGNPMHLHPLQQAFITYGSVQCGFCSPGFIVSAYALLQKNASPTREEVRKWFYDHHNYCRCTGYKQIVDAVMAAAAVMRGEKTMDDITYHPEPGKFINTSMPRPDAIGKVTGTVDYGEDTSLKLPDGTLHLAVVQPRVTHHANILSIDTSEAEKMPGVVKVITGKDVPGNNMLNQYPYYFRNKILTPTRELLCTKKIKRWGDVIALVAADTREHAREAAKHVKMEYEQLPEYIGRNDAIMPGAVSVHEGYPNDYHDLMIAKGDDAGEIIDSAPYSVKGNFYCQRQPHLSLEGDIIIAFIDENGKLAIESKSQSIYGNQRVMGKGIGVDSSDIRILQHGAVGASFGWSVDSTDQALAGIACLVTGHPVSLVMSWEEQNHYVGKRAPFMGQARMSCDENGKITALDFHVGDNQGAYVEYDGCFGSFMRLGVPYTIPNIRGLAHVFSSNMNTCTAWRGYGAPQAAMFSESLVDMLAEKYGMDPFEFRYRNLMRGHDLDTTGGDHENADQFPKLMDMARPFYEECRKRAKADSTDQIKRGVGVSNAIFFPTMGTYDTAGTTIELREDNRFYVHNTYHAMGQGGNVSCLAATLEALKELNLKPEDVQVDIDDSEYCPDSGISAQSRSFVMNTGAIVQAANMIKEAMRKPDGTFRTYQEMVNDGIKTSYTAKFTQPGRKTTFRNINTNYGEISPRPVFSTNVCEVAVDTKTGKTKVLSYHAWADCGVIGNYLGANGQAYGGIAQAIGYALSEDYDEKVKKYGNPISSGLPSIEDVPDDMEVTWLEDLKNPGNPFGSNGLSECFAAGQSIAVLNAIYHATGVRIYDQPATKEKVKKGLDRIAEGKEPEELPEFYLGPNNMYDEIEYLMANPAPENWHEIRQKQIAVKEGRAKSEEVLPDASQVNDYT